MVMIATTAKAAAATAPTTMPPIRAPPPKPFPLVDARNCSGRESVGLAVSLVRVVAHRVGAVVVISLEN